MKQITILDVLRAVKKTLPPGRLKGDLSSVIYVLNWRHSRSHYADCGAIVLREEETAADRARARAKTKGARNAADDL